MKNPGQVTKELDGYRARFERVYPYNIETIWNAITDPEKLRIWFTDVDMDFQEGGDMTIYFRDDNHTATKGRIITINKPHLFVFTWEHEMARWELFEEGKNKCKLVLTYSRLDEEFAASAPAGLHWLLDRLQSTVEGRTEPYPFGTDLNDPDQRRLQVEYETVVLEQHPELKRIQPVVVERTLKASIDEVYRALTDKDEMKQWYFDIPDFKPAIGQEFRFLAGPPNGKQWLHLCKVTEVKTNSVIAYNWSYDGYEGESKVRFLLFPEGENTLLRITHSGLHTFPPDVDELKKENFKNGWTSFLESITEHLGKRRPSLAGQ